MEGRFHLYSRLFEHFAGLDDTALAELVAGVSSAQVGTGGRSGMLTVEGAPVFVKEVPLTELERRTENFLSTANLFQLPEYFQYGVGSPGFGAWRELAAHAMTTDWVRSGQASEFPLLYHWRVLPSPALSSPTPEAQAKTEEHIAYWGGAPEIRARYEALRDAGARIVLLLEYVPKRLEAWLNEEFAKGDEAAERAIEFLEPRLLRVNSFMGEREFLHFDAHFHNILTDGQQLYFTDFGLAISRDFELSNREIEFFNRHRGYDLHMMAAGIVYGIVIARFGRKDWYLQLEDYLAGKLPPLPPGIDKVLRRYAPVATGLGDFSRAMRADPTKRVVYPAERLTELFRQAIALR